MPQKFQKSGGGGVKGFWKKLTIEQTFFKVGPPLVRGGGSEVGVHSFKGEGLNMSGKSRETRNEENVQ